MLNPNKKKVPRKSEAEIGAIGEKLVGLHFESQGLSTNIDTKGPGKTDVEVRNGRLFAIIQVKTGVYPNEPADLSKEEIAAIKRRAGQLECDALGAKVQLDKEYNLKGEIKFQELQSFFD